MSDNTFVVSLSSEKELDFSWGKATWLVRRHERPAAQQALCMMTINPGGRNPDATHPNCDELIYVLSGELEETVAGQKFHLTPGSLIRIPEGVRHQARCVGSEPVVTLMTFSSPDPQTEIHDEGGMG